MNFSVSRSYACLSIALALTSMIALPGQCQQKKPKRAAHSPVAASRKNNASVAAFQAAFSGDLVKLKGIIPSGGGIQMQDKNGKTLLHHAVLGGRMAVVQWLVSQKVPLNTTDASGVSALAFARQNTSDADMEDRRAEIIRFLQEQGAQEIGKAPEIPINYAHETKKLETVKSRPDSLLKLLGKSRQEVERVLGTPTRESSTSGGGTFLSWGSNDDPTTVSAFWDIDGQMDQLHLPGALDWRKSLAQYGLSDAGVRSTKTKTEKGDKYDLLNIKGIPKGWDCTYFDFYISLLGFYKR